ncbi:MAG: CoA transferase [Pseudomonadales bacterium]|nr:CoA transferase [Pseudomonadales bacterium]HJN52430.1 CoA transferase [Pseudomonadales bacterium]|tara:strand:+ start:9542 stop:11965 length:2424 start_codon:yes stop_codon:yes gene_type:complete
MSDPYAGIRVLDLSDRLAGAFAARLFGDFGAEVILAEPPDGHPIRHEPPFLDNRPGPDRGVLHAYVNWNKHSVVVRNSDELDELVASADVVVTTSANQEGDVFAAIARNGPSDLIHLSITPHGLDGPLADTAGNNLTACARMGWSYVNVLQDEPPLQLPNRICGYVAGINGFLGAAAALLQRTRTGCGERIDVSEVESLALTCHPWTIQAILFGVGDSHGVLGAKPRGLPGPLWEAKDGLVNFGFGDWHNWTESMHLLNLPEFADDPELIPDIGRHGKDLSGVVAGAARTVASLDRWEVFHGLSKMRSICGVVQNMEDKLQCEQLASRDYLVSSRVDDCEIRFPGPPARLAPAEWRLRRPAPGIGQSTGSIEVKRRSPEGAPQGRDVPSPEGPLGGVRVLAFTHAWSGTFSTELLALLGADVVQIEAPHRVDVWRRTNAIVPWAIDNPDKQQHPVNTQGLYNAVNLNKRAITIDMSRDEGKKLFWDLVPNFDVVVENFTPPIMGRWGITLETLAAKRPGVVFASISAYGASGPYADYPGNGATTEPMSGLSSIHGYEGDKGLNTGGLIPDPICGYFMAAAIVSALHARDRTGEAQRIDESMLEAMTIVIGDTLGAYQATGEMPAPMGNKHPRVAPHSVYPTRDGDWVAIACETDDAWERMAELLGVADDERFRSMAARKHNEEAIDSLVAAWTETHTAVEAADIVNGLGGTAARITPPYEIYTKPDADLQARGFLHEIEHPETGPHILPGMPWKFASVTPPAPRPSPCVGQHSEEVLRQELALAEQEYRDLVDRAITGTIYEVNRAN